MDEPDLLRCGRAGLRRDGPKKLADRNWDGWAEADQNWVGSGLDGWRRAGCNWSEARWDGVSSNGTYSNVLGR